MAMRRRPAKHNPFLAANVVGKVTFSIAAELADSITVSLQLQDANGRDLAVRGSVQAYLSDDANGDSVTATAPDTVAGGTDGIVMESISNKLMTLVSEADGDIDIAIGENAATTWYLVVILPDGSLAVSGAIAFA